MLNGFWCCKICKTQNYKKIYIQKSMYKTTTNRLSFADACATRLRSSFINLSRSKKNRNESEIYFFNRRKCRRLFVFSFKLILTSVVGSTTTTSHFTLYVLFKSKLPLLYYIYVCVNNQSQS
jgi:hypothetical protein